MRLFSDIHNFQINFLYRKKNKIYNNKIKYNFYVLPKRFENKNIFNSIRVIKKKSLAIKDKINANKPSTCCT